MNTMLASARKMVGRWWSHQRTAVYMLSYPKCGRTWLRLMMGKALVDDLDLSTDPMELNLLHKASRRVPRIRVTHDDMPQLKRPDAVEHDKRRYAGKRVIFLVRDPRDTLISYYFQATKRRDRYEGTPADFLRHDVGALDTIIAYYNVWAEARTVPRTFCLIRYEDLHRDPVGELGRALDVVGHVPPRHVLETAVEFSRFDNMRKLETAAAVGAYDRMKPADEKDLESYKTRKGKVGGYRDYLSADDIAYMNDRIARTLSPYYASYLVAP
jgi:hypothetical protein